MLSVNPRKRAEQIIGMFLVVLVIVGTGAWLYAGSPTPHVEGESAGGDVVQTAPVGEPPLSADGRPQLVVDAEQTLKTGAGNVPDTRPAGTAAGWQVRCRHHGQLHECVGVHPERDRIAYEISGSPDTASFLKRRLIRDEKR